MQPWDCLEWGLHRHVYEIKFSILLTLQCNFIPQKIYQDKVPFPQPSNQNLSVFLSFSTCGVRVVQNGLKLLPQPIWDANKQEWNWQQIEKKIACLGVLQAIVNDFQLEW
jgi:hypothetical protein